MLRLPECVDVRRSADTRRSAPAGAGKFVRQTAAAERISSTLLAARMPRRSGPSYSRTWSRRSGAFQYLASKYAGAPNDRQPPRYRLCAHRDPWFHPVRMSWVQAYCRGSGAQTLSDALASQPRGCLMSAFYGIVLQRPVGGACECSGEPSSESACRGASRSGEFCDFQRRED